MISSLYLVHWCTHIYTCNRDSAKAIIFAAFHIWSPYVAIHVCLPKTQVWVRFASAGRHQDKSNTPLLCNLLSQNMSLLAVPWQIFGRIMCRPLRPPCCDCKSWQHRSSFVQTVCLLIQQRWLQNLLTDKKKLAHGRQHLGLGILDLVSHW